MGGTDGTDHQYRERVAAQYGVSATNKARLKLLVSVHYLLGAAHLARLGDIQRAVESLTWLRGISVEAAREVLIKYLENIEVSLLERRLMTWSLKNPKEGRR